MRPRRPITDPQGTQHLVTRLFRYRCCRWYLRIMLFVDSKWKMRPSSASTMLLSSMLTTLHSNSLENLVFLTMSFWTADGSKCNSTGIVWQQMVIMYRLTLLYTGNYGCTSDVLQIGKILHDFYLYGACEDWRYDVLHFLLTFINSDVLCLMQWSCRAVHAVHAHVLPSTLH